jgi:hypothetical protein
LDSNLGRRDLRRANGYPAAPQLVFSLYANTNGTHLATKKGVAQVATSGD